MIAADAIRSVAITREMLHEEMIVVRSNKDPEIRVQNHKDPDRLNKIADHNRDKVVNNKDRKGQDFLNRVRVGSSKDRRRDKKDRKG